MNTACPSRPAGVEHGSSALLVTIPMPAIVVVVPVMLLVVAVMPMRVVVRHDDATCQTGQTDGTDCKNKTFPHGCFLSGILSLRVQPRAHVPRFHRECGLRLHARRAVGKAITLDRVNPTRSDRRHRARWLTRSRHA